MVEDNGNQGSTKNSYYPISGRVLKAEGQPPIQVEIVRLENLGLIFKSTQHFFRPGENYTLEFDLPLSDLTLKEGIKIIKTYEKVEEFLDAGEKKRVMTVEVHFKSLSPEKKTAIQNFILKIGQKKI